MNMESDLPSDPLSSPQPPSSAAASTPDQAPSTAIRNAHPGVRRVHTLPPKLAGSSAPAIASAPDSVETLFTHPVVKVVSFSVPGFNAISSASRRSSVGTGTDGTLPWETPSQSTLAVGPLRIYRVPSSGVSFLNSGPFLQPRRPLSS